MQWAGCALRSASAPPAGARQTPGIILLAAELPEIYVIFHLKIPSALRGDDFRPPKSAAGAPGAVFGSWKTPPPPRQGFLRLQNARRRPGMDSWRPKTPPGAPAGISGPGNSPPAPRQRLSAPVCTCRRSGGRVSALAGSGEFRDAIAIFEAASAQVRHWRGLAQQARECSSHTAGDRSAGYSQ